MKNVALSVLALALAWPVPSRAHGDEPDEPGADLMNDPVTVTTRKQRALRDAPGVVTIITREDIMASGARDLVDVLEMVPGLQFGVDVEGALGPSVRGLWGTEGKVLLLVDGIEMNERLYGTNQYGMGLPVELIERIEIIRGPGSVVYGGFAELAVVQVTTVQPETLGGLELHGMGSLMETEPGRLGAAAAWGRAFDDDLRLSVSAYGAHGAMSHGTYTQPVSPPGGGPTRDLSGTTQDARWLNLFAEYRGLALRFLYDGQSHDSRDGYGEVLDRTARLGFTGYFAEARYTLALGERVVVTPRLGFKRQQPWRSDDATLPTFYAKTADKFSGGLTVDAELVEDLDLQAAVEVFHDHGRLDDPREIGTQRTFGGKRALEVTNGAGYVQAIWNPELITLVAGLRGEFSEQFTGTVVPRVGVIWSRDRFFVKGLLSRAFRTPAMENIGLTHSTDIRPEQTTVLEAEVGYVIPYTFALTANVFDMRLQDPIVFTYNQTADAEQYTNEQRTGSRGIEVVQRVMGAWGQTELSYSHYTARDINRVARYAVPGEASALLGAAQHKLAFRGRFVAPARFTVAPSAVFLSERYGVDGAWAEPWEPDGFEPRIHREPPVLRLNLFVSYSPPGTNRLYVGAGVFDATDSGYRAVQPHDSGHGTLPLAGREWLVKVGYALPFGGDTPPEP